LRFNNILYSEKFFFETQQKNVIKVLVFNKPKQNTKTWTGERGGKRRELINISKLCTCEGGVRYSSQEKNVDESKPLLLLT